MMRSQNYATLRREASLKAFQRWLATCQQPLLITSTPYSGKTYFVNQLQSETECVAVHFCRREVPESSEAATLIRSIAAQLVRRFPNLVLPQLSTVTLLADFISSLEHYLSLPLASLPPPAKPLFLVIDDIQPHVYEVVFALQQCLPLWLKLVVTMRALQPSDEHKFTAFHSFDLSAHPDEIRRFIEMKLPQCSHEEVFDACMDSWFYVDQLSRTYEHGMLSYECIPFGTEELIQEICQVLPQRFTIYLMLIKASRHPPTHHEMLAVSQIIIHDVLSNIQKDLEDVSPIFSCRDPYVLAGSWADFVGDLTVYHSAWAEHFKMKKQKTPQDLIELAYHLAHSDVPGPDGVKILSSLGVSNLILKCSVIDLPTTNLLVRSGVVVQEQGEYDDFVYLCSIGDLRRVDRMVEAATERELSLGLLSASSRGHVGVCCRILDLKPSCSHFVSEEQWNALRSAACNNHLDVLDMLIQHGINVDECGNGGRTALRAAAWSGHRAIVARLLEASADVEKRDSEGRTALMAAAFMDHSHIVEDLLAYKADVKQTDNSGATPLHLALSNGSKTEQHNKTIDVLLERGSDVNMCDANGRQCIHLAAYHGDENLEKIIEKAKNIDAQDLHGRTPLMLAASQGQLASANKLIEKGADIDSIDEQGRTSLMHAAIHNHLPIVDLLLSLGADEDHKDNDGAVALHYAVVHDNVSLVRALSSLNTLSAIDRSGNHPLMIAVQHPNVEVVHELLEAGAPVHMQSLEGHSALRVAAMAGFSEIVDILAPFIDDWEQADLDGTPLVHTLLIHGKHSMCELLLNLGSFSTSRDSHGRTCAHVVAGTNDLQGARMLRRLAVSFELGDSCGRTPLQTAVWAGHTEMCAYLLEHVGVNPNASDQQGASALSIASQLGNREIVILLLRFGAEPNQRDVMGRSSLDIARLSGHEHIRSILKSACGSADSSGFGSMPNSPIVDKSLNRRKSKLQAPNYNTASPKLRLK